jgi:activator of HSP90 ATPase
MTRPIQQSVTLRTVPRELSNTFLDSKKYTALTGALAKIGEKAGAAFTAFGGQLVGRTLLAVPGRLIVQSWPSGDWKVSDPDSMLMLEFSKTKSGGRIDLVHVGVPQHDRRGMTNGWNDSTGLRGESGLPQVGSDERGRGEQHSHQPLA